MADFDPNDPYAGLTGLLSQFQPSDADIARAKQARNLEFFLGMLGAPKGGEFRAIGQSGIQAMQDYDKRIQLEQAIRNQNIQAATPLIQLAMQRQVAQQMGNMLNGGGQQPGQLPAGSVGGTGMGGGTAATFGPSSQPGPVSGPGNPNAPDLYTQLTNFNLAQMPITGKDYSAAIKARFPEGVAQRPGAFTRYPNGTANFNPVMPPGFMPVDVNDPLKGIQPIPGYQAAQATNAATAQAAKTALEAPQPVIDNAGNETLPPGGKLTQLFGNGPLPYGVPSPYPQGAPAAAAPTQAPAAPSAPSRVLKLGPEQTENAKSLGEDAAAYRNAVSSSSKAMAQLSELSDSLQYFTPGPTLPARAAVAGYAQEVPLVGRSLADKLVPNSAAALPAIAAMEKIGVGLTAEQSKVFGSREGQQVIGMIKSAMPNAAMVPGAPQVIIEAQKGVHQWIIDKGNAAQAYLGQNGTLQGFSNAWDQAHPVSSYVGNLPALAALAQGSKAAPQAAPQPPAQPQGRTVVRTGTFNGKRVVQYSDGTTQYAQ